MAQLTPDNQERDVHTSEYFLILEKKRLYLFLDSASVQQDKEAAIVKALQNKNDSLHKTGNIYDSVSADITTRLLGFRQKNDSIRNIIGELNRKIKSTRSLRKGFSQLSSSVPEFYNQVKRNAPVHEQAFRGIKIELDSANLSGEKGRLKTVLNSAAAQTEKETAVIGQLGNKKDSLLTTGNVDKSVSEKLDTRLTAYQNRLDSIGTEINLLKQKLDSPGEFTKDFKTIKTKITLIDSVVNKNAAVREYIFQMIDEGISKSTKKLYSLAAFFGPGGFIIPENKYHIAQKYFSPIIDSLIQFSNNYSGVLRTASIVVYGYSDGTGIPETSKLYKTLTTQLNIPQPGKEELNRALSSLRAAEISKFLNALMKEKYPNFKAIDKIVFESVEIGLGEKLPDPNIKNYTTNDERRRVVIIYWNVLPIE